MWRRQGKPRARPRSATSENELGGIAPRCAQTFLNKRGRPKGGPKHSDRKRLIYLVAFLNASFTLPVALCRSPLALSNLPSVSSCLSPVTLPAVSLMTPFALSAAPRTCSLSILASIAWVVDRTRKRHESFLTDTRYG